MPRNRLSHPPQGAGHGGPARGSGWGGPAKGVGSAAPTHEPFNDYVAPPNSEKVAAKVASARELQEFYTAMVRDEGQHGMVRLSAADKLYDRIEGKPVQRNVNVNVDDPSSLSDPDLDAEIERRARSLVALAEGEAPTGLPN